MTSGDFLEVYVVARGIGNLGWSWKVWVRKFECETFSKSILNFQVETFAGDWNVSGLFFYVIGILDYFESTLVARKGEKKKNNL